MNTFLAAATEGGTIIISNWLTCYITYTDRKSDRKGKTAKVRAIVVDRKIQAYANSKAHYDKKGLIGTILDFFVTSPHGR
jgi:hypothetical protein